METITKTIALNNWTGDSMQVTLDADNCFEMYGYHFNLVWKPTNGSAIEVELNGTEWKWPLTSWWMETQGMHKGDASRGAMLERAVQYVANHV